jgi:hypothetical protein
MKTALILLVLVACFDGYAYEKYVTPPEEQARWDNQPNPLDTIIEGNDAKKRAEAAKNGLWLPTMAHCAVGGATLLYIGIFWGIIPLFCMLMTRWTGLFGLVFLVCWVVFAVNRIDEFLCLFVVLPFMGLRTMFGKR